MAQTDYRKPGAYTREAPTPGSPAPIFRPAIVAILGRAMESLQLTTAEVVSFSSAFMNDDATPILRYKVQLDYDRVSDDEDFAVKDADDVAYEETTDYTVDYFTGAITLLTIDPPVITDDTTWLHVTYNHLPAGFYTPKNFFDYDDVVDYYGDPLDVYGNIQNPLVLACGFALQNAPWVVAFPVDPTCGGDNPEETVIGTDDWQYTIDEQLALKDVDIVVTLCEMDEAGYQNGEHMTIYGYMNSHLTDMCSETGRMERVWIFSDMYGMDVFAEDPYPNMVTEDTMWGLEREEEIYVCPPGTTWYNYRKVNPETNGPGVAEGLDGNYLCAYLAGLMAQNDPQMPLTFKKVYNFSGLGDEYKEAEMNVLASKGCTVMEPHAWGLRVRHGVTCDLDKLESMEINVVRAKHYMCKYLRGRLEEQFVGMPITGTTFLSVASMTYAMLILLEDAGLIYGFRNVKARANPSRPTEVIVKYEYCPAYGLNYIIIEFTVNPTLLTSQTAEASVAGGQAGIST